MTNSGAVRLAAIGIAATAALATLSAPASAETNLGGVNIQAYCDKTSRSILATGRSKAVNIRGTWDGWQCIDGYGPTYAQYRGVDMNAACDMQYGKKWFWEKKAIAKLASKRDMWSWYCVRP